MINLLQEKLEAVENLRNYTKQILLLSPKQDYSKINNMIVKRQEYEIIVNSIDEKIEELKVTEKFCEDSMIFKSLINDIRESIKQTIVMDKEIRKKLNDEIKNIKEDLHQPERTLKLNLKA